MVVLQDRNTAGDGEDGVVIRSAYYNMNDKEMDESSQRSVLMNQLRREKVRVTVSYKIGVVCSCIGITSPERVFTF